MASNSDVNTNTNNDYLLTQINQLKLLIQRNSNDILLLKSEMHNNNNINKVNTSNPNNPNTNPNNKPNKHINPIQIHINPSSSYLLFKHIIKLLTKFFIWIKNLIESNLHKFQINIKSTISTTINSNLEFFLSKQKLIKRFKFQSIENRLTIKSNIWCKKYSTSRL